MEAQVTHVPIAARQAPPGSLRDVILALLLLVVALCVVLAGWAGWFVARDRAVILNQLWGGAVIEGVVLIQGVVAIVLGATGAGAGDPLLFWGYYATTLVILPVAAAWAFAERTKWSSVVLLVASLTVAFLEWRLWQIWMGA
jgi:hypothetical protein